jgi:hypothetical protein
MSNVSTMNEAIDAAIDTMWCTPIYTSPPPEASNELKNLIKLLNQYNNPDRKVFHMVVREDDDEQQQQQQPHPPPPLNLTYLRGSFSYGMEDFVQSQSPDSEGSSTPSMSPIPGHENIVSDMDAVD